MANNKVFVLEVSLAVNPKKERFFEENGQKHCFFTNIGIFCSNFVISMLWEVFWGALHVCRSKIGDVENSFHICQIFEFPRPRGCSWRGYATQEADQELKWKLRTISVWENWVLEFLGSQSWDTKGGSARTPPTWDSRLKKPTYNRVKFFDWHYLHLTALMKETYFNLQLKYWWNF